jgi:hypothetical protein
MLFIQENEGNYLTEVADKILFIDFETMFEILKFDF